MLAALILSACASTAAPGIAAKEPAYISSVEVIEHDTSAPPAFADALRDAVLATAVFYGNTGRAITLRIDVDRVHFKNTLQAMFIGDNNLASGRVAVLDPATATQLGAFPVQVDAERPGGGTGSFALDVIGVFDPTGLVSIASAAGSAASADINRSGTAIGMRVNFAAETLRQTFGDAKARVANKAQQDQARAQAKTHTPAR
jgi:hypothetical protein